MAGVERLFEKMGARPGRYSVQKFGSIENFVVRKRGGSEGIIVVGAHYDKVSVGCGAVDNWSGVVALAHLYKTLKRLPLNRTVMFVAFGKEEDGLLGSRAMVDALGADQVGQYCAMINLDSFGRGGPRVALNISSERLVGLTADAARGLNLPFRAEMVGGSSDSRSFIEKGIPALTIYGLDEDFGIIHTPLDRASRVRPMSVYLGYRLALQLALRLDKSPCGGAR